MLITDASLFGTKFLRGEDEGANSVHGRVSGRCKTLRLLLAGTAVEVWENRSAEP